MSLIQKLTRFASLTGHLLQGVKQASQLQHALAEGIPDAEFQAIRQQWMASMCQRLPLTIETRGTPIKSPALWVSNHVSWMDIPVIGSLAPVGFLSKAEVANWPIVGKLSARSGTLFIRRGGNSAAEEAINTMKRHLQRHHSVLFFPEGTTTSGVRVRSFHPRLLAAAIDLELPVQPVSIRYLDATGGLSKVAPFIDNVSFASHFWQVLDAAPMRAEVNFLEPIAKTKNLPRKELARALQALVATSLSVQ